MTLVAAAVLVGSTATADDGITIRALDEAPFELLQPVVGEVLVAGRPATVAWRERCELSGEGIHEWEAFLSYDGGRSWPVRITPHLDIDHSSFRFTVPPIPSDDVRLMLRFGDEHREVGFILPTVWRSVVPVATPAWSPAPTPAFAPGEVARPGVPGVVLWVEGAADGRGVRMRASAWTPPSLRSRHQNHLTQWPVVVPPDRRMADGTTDRMKHTETTGPAHRSPSFDRAPGFVLSLLLLVCRRNE